jgi:hypothetical protein
LADGGAQPLTVEAAAARVDHRHGIAADYETNVGYAVGVFRSRIFIQSLPYVDARSYFFCCQRWRASSRGDPNAEITRARY